MEVTNLKAYLANINFRMKDLAELLGCSTTHISRVISGKANASKKLAKEISDLTNGVIQLNIKERKKYKRKSDKQESSK